MNTTATYLRGERVRGRFWRLKRGARRSAELMMALLDAILPKRRNRIVLGCDKGAKFNGNPRELFEYLAPLPDWDAYWLTSSPTLLAKLQKQFPKAVVPAWSLKALWLGLTSSWLCVSHSRYDLGPFAYLAKPRFLYLNHGVPLKTMGYSKAYADPNVDEVAAMFGAITCCSPVEGALWEKAYRLPPERMWVTGTPRNDRLFQPKSEVRAKLGLDPDQKIILFAPTYRESGVLGDYLPAPGIDVDRMIAILDRYNATLLIRPHYYEAAAAETTVEHVGSPRFVTADEAAVPDVNDLLPFVDILITDYSSIYFDYLLLDRPIIFSCHDVEAYARERGFMMDYESNTPGAKVRTGSSFLDALELELGGSDPFREMRGLVRQRFHTHPDGRSAKRVAARILAS